MGIVPKIVLPVIWIFYASGFVSGASLSGNQQDSIKAMEFFRQALAYGLNGNPEHALEYFKQSLSYRQKVFGEKHYRLGSTYLGMAIQYKNLHQLDSAYGFYRKAEEMYLYNTPANDSRLGDLYTNMGNYFRVKGNLGEAIRYQERAVYIYENSPDKIPIDNYLSVVYNLADVYHLANREEEALQLALEFYNKGSVNHQIRYKNLISSIYISLGQPGKAGFLQKEIIRTIIANFGEESYLLADQYAIYAQFLNRISLEDSAMIYLKKAENIYKKFDNSQADLSDLYTFYAEAYAGKKIISSDFQNFKVQKTYNLLSAVSFYKKAIDILSEPEGVDSPGMSTFRNSNYPVPTLRILRDIGMVYKQLANFSAAGSRDEKIGHLSRAIEYFRQGSDLVEYLRTGFVSEESKLQFMELQQSIFRYTIETAYELYDQTGQQAWAEIAFENSERNKAVSLFDKISENRVRKFSLIPDSLTQLELRYSTSISYYKEQLWEAIHGKESDSVRIADLKALVFNTEQKFNDLQVFLERNFREYFKMKYELTPITFRDIQQRLKRNEMLLSFSINSPPGEDSGELYIFAISKRGVQFLKSAYDRQCIDDIKTIYSVVSDPGFLNIRKKGFAGYIRSAFGIYSRLIAHLEGMKPGKRITVIPDGILSYLPFEALLTRETSASAVHFYDLPYLIHDYTINYAYSAQLFLMTSGIKPGRRMRAAAFSPVYPEVSVLNEDSLHLLPLAGIHEEVDYLDRKIRTVVFDGEDATEKNFRKNAGYYQILHLAMHTLINDTLPLFSRLAFYPAQPDTVSNDGWLTTSDIYNLKLNAAMTVLSACRSGSGILIKGEGIMSLARGFFYAGCPSVVLTLWEVEDRSGTGIMKEFYRNLKNGKPKDTALRNAKIKHILNADPMFSHPHFWSGYVCIGNAKPLFRGPEKYFIALMALALSVFVLKIIIKKNRI